MKFRIVHTGRRGAAVSRRTLFGWLAGGAAIIAASGAGGSGAAFAQTAPARRYGRSGIDLAARDLSVRPGDDFDAYATGGWRRTAVIPPDDVETGVYREVADRTQARLRAIIDDAVARPSNATHRKLGDLYAAYMDEARIERLGAAPLEADLAAIRAVSDKPGMARLMGAAQGGFGKSFFDGLVWADAKIPLRNALRLTQGGLGLPDRQMYLGEQFKPLRSAYRDYVARTLKLAGWAEPDAAADAVVAMETRIAEGSWPASDSRDRSRMYNPMSTAELRAMAPGFAWDAWLEGAGLHGLERVIPGQKTAFPKIAAVFAEAPLETLKAWQAFHTVDQASAYLSRSFADSRFAFRGKAEQGLEAEEPRWRRGVGLLDELLGEPLGREYAARHFPPEHKAAVEEMVVNLKAAMEARIRRLEWMGPQTKSAALAKLKRLRVMVGYPEVWRDYSGLRIDRGDLYGDVRRTRAFNWAWQVGKLPLPVDQNEWWQWAHMIDAYSDFSRVALGFPAGILQPPYFDPSADPAASYGAAGAVIGHEIIHQFDDQGSRVDATGALADWWAPQDAARFKAATEALVRQVDAYEVVPGVTKTGRLTLGENIADLAGLTLALDAYRASLKGRPAPVIDGLTGDQRVFLGWAQSWRTKMRPEIERQEAARNVHALPRFRVIGPTRNLDAWYAAFDVRPGDRYYLAPEERVRIW